MVAECGSRFFGVVGVKWFCCVGGVFGFRFLLTIFYYIIY